MTISESRRTFLKSTAAAATASAAGIPLATGQAAAQVANADIRWDKAPCRFCGTGCSRRPHRAVVFTRQAPRQERAPACYCRHVPLTCLIDIRGTPLMLSG